MNIYNYVLEQKKEKNNLVDYTPIYLISLQLIHGRVLHDSEIILVAD